MGNKTKKWLKAAGVRAVKTVAQAALGAMSGAVMFSQINAKEVISIALFAGLYSLITSVAGLPEVK